MKIPSIKQALIILLVILGLLSTTTATYYTVGYSHELTNANILKHYGIGSTIYIWLMPQTIPAAFFGPSNALLATEPNLTTLSYLLETNSVGYNALLLQVAHNENRNNQTDGFLISLAIVWALYGCLLYYISKHIYTPPIERDDDPPANDPAVSAEDLDGIWYITKRRLPRRYWEEAG